MELNKIYNMDCMEGMKQFPDKFFDLAIVDPPYGSSIMQKNKRQRHRTTDTGYRNKTIPPSSYYKELERVAKRSIIWGAQYQIQYLNPEGSFIVWDKGANPDLHNMSACDIAWYSERQRIRKVYMHWCGAVKCESEPTIHIHQKPVSLYRWLLTHYATPGMKILDTHAGSCSSVVACEDMGFEYVAFELDPGYYADACKRVAQFKAKLKLF